MGEFIKLVRASVMFSARRSPASTGCWSRRIGEVIAHYQGLVTTATLPACRRGPVSRSEPIYNN
jgi:hypothetical protein